MSLVFFNRLFCSPTVEGDVPARTYLAWYCSGTTETHATYQSFDWDTCTDIINFVSGVNRCGMICHNRPEIAYCYLSKLYIPFVSHLQWVDCTGNIWEPMTLCIPVGSRTSTASTTASSTATATSTLIASVTPTSSRPPSITSTPSPSINPMILVDHCSDRLRDEVTELTGVAGIAPATRLAPTFQISSGFARGSERGGSSSRGDDDDGWTLPRGGGHGRHGRRHSGGDSDDDVRNNDDDRDNDDGASRSRGRHNRGPALRGFLDNWFEVDQLVPMGLCGGLPPASAHTFFLQLPSDVTLGGTLQVSVCSSSMKSAVISAGKGCSCSRKSFRCVAASEHSYLSLSCNGGRGYATTLRFKAAQHYYFLQLGKQYGWSAISNFSWAYTEPGALDSDADDDHWRHSHARRDDDDASDDDGRRSRR